MFPTALPGLKQQIKSKDHNQNWVLCWSFTSAVGCVLLTENRCAGAVPESGSFWGVFDKHSNCHKATVKHTLTHKWTVWAVCLRQAKISHSLTVKSWMCDALIWRRTTFALWDTVRRGYLFSQIIKVSWGSSASRDLNCFQRGKRSKLRTWLQRMLILPRDGLPVAVLHVVQESGAGVRQRLRRRNGPMKNANLVMVLPMFRHLPGSPTWLIFSEEKSKQINKQKT